MNFFLDVCKDSGDDDDNSDASSTRTEGFAVMDIIEEYEVADDSESEDVSEASSGTEVRQSRQKINIDNNQLIF